MASPSESEDLSNLENIIPNGPQKSQRLDPTYAVNIQYGLVHTCTKYEDMLIKHLKSCLRGHLF